MRCSRSASSERRHGYGSWTMVGGMVRHRRFLSAAALLPVLLAGCAVQVPADPNGTLDRVEGGELRVGATANPPWVVLDDESAPSGIEPDLIEEFADRLGADVDWTTGSEAVLLDALDAGEIDLVLGGFRDDTPWNDRGAITRPYREVEVEGRTEKHVMIARMGENGFLVELERFLTEEAGR